MKIDVLCNDGSPLGVTLKDLWGEGNRGIGIGGSEYALLTMCEEWHKAGHEVVLYNNPVTPYGSPFEQRAIHDYDPGSPRDALIIFRSPSTKSIATCNCLKVWWSCDQYTIGDFAEFSRTVNKIVCISNFHSNFFRDFYRINNSIVIDLPVRIQDIKDAEEVQKVPKKVIFTSVPDRGLNALNGLWAAIQDRCPDVSLIITSDYRLWGVDERNWEYRERWQGRKNVFFLGAVMRKQLIGHQLESQILAYPCIYDELFCISVAEAQCCGIYPVTTGVGALATTNMGKIVPGHPRHDGGFGVEFVDTIVNLLNGDPQELARLQQETKEKAIARFDPVNILRQWHEKVFDGG